MPAYESLLKDTKKDLSEKAESVIDKEQVAPSGDKHDYVSLAPYFWPDPATPDGLPYIRKDGHWNPDADSNTNSDARRIERMILRVKKFALAYYFTGEDRYAKKGAELIRTFFLDSTSAMNPHLKYAQGVKGGKTGRGVGIIETRTFPDLIDSITLLSASPAWRKEDDKQMRDWAGRYFRWLTKSSHGKKEAHAGNNHGTYFDVQYVALAQYLGKKELATTVLEAAKKHRIALQIDPSGKQPHELKRTNTLHYSLFNLRGLFELAALGKNAGIDLFNYETEDGRSLRKAFDFMAPYADSTQKWPYARIAKFEYLNFVPILKMGKWAYRDANIDGAIASLPKTETSEHLFNLLYPTAP